MIRFSLSAARLLQVAEVDGCCDGPVAGVVGVQVAAGVVARVELLRVGRVGDSGGDGGVAPQPWSW
jgi:hypothetical protein